MKVSEIFTCGSRYGGYDNGRHDGRGHDGYRGYRSRGYYGGGRGYGHHRNNYDHHYGGLIRLDIL